MSEGPFQRRGPRRIGAQRGAPPAPGEPESRDPARPADRHGPDRGLILIGLAVVGLAIALVVLFVPPIALLDDEPDPDDLAVGQVIGDQIAGLGIRTELRERLPDVPDNLQPVSPIYDVVVPDDIEGPFVFTLRLNTPSQDQRNLGAYTFLDGLWERLDPAQLTSDGVAAAVELEFAPANLAIMRRLQFRDTVTGTLPQGADLAADAVNTLTIINPEGFVPAADGSLLGRVEALPSDVTQAIYPVVHADATQADTLNTVIASEQLRRQHINNILLMVQTGRYDGVDINYQFIVPSLREEFTSFINELADQLHRDTRGISVHVPLPRRDASGFNEGAYDLAALGAAVDLIKLSPPRDQSIFRQTLANSLPAVLNRVPREKVLLTVSPLSVLRAAATTQVLTQREALALAATVSVQEPGPILAGSRVTLVGNSLFQDGGASGLFWDPFANSVSFTYPDRNGQLVTVWIENRFSMAFKLDLIGEFNLGGIALDNVSADPGGADLWETISNFMESGGVRLTLPNDELLVPVWEADEGELGGSGSAGWVVWTTPTRPGQYELRLIVSDGDVRVGRAISVRVEG